MASGASPAATAAAMAAATGTPGRAPPRSPVVCTLVAPWAPSVGGDGVGVAAGVDGLDGAGQLAGLGEDLEGGGDDLAVGGLGEDPDLGKRHGQGLLDDLEVVEEVDDLLEAGAVVLDDLAGLAGRCGLDADDLLAGAGPADAGGVEAEVGDGDLVDRLATWRP